MRGLVATSDWAGYRMRRVLTDPAEAVRTVELCYASRGFPLHAAPCIPAGDTDGLERLCRYVARPPLAAGRLIALSEDELLFKLKTPWSDGMKSLIFSPIELIAP